MFESLFKTVSDWFTSSETKPETAPEVKPREMDFETMEFHCFVLINSRCEKAGFKSDSPENISQCDFYIAQYHFFNDQVVAKKGKALNADTLNRVETMKAVYVDWNNKQALETKRQKWAKIKADKAALEIEQAERLQYSAVKYIPETESQIRERILAQWEKEKQENKANRIKRNMRPDIVKQRYNKFITISKFSIIPFETYKNEFAETVAAMTDEHFKKWVKEMRVKYPNPKTDFYRSPEWKALRMRVFRAYPNQCMKCGCKHDLEIDHILPRSKFPALALAFNNMQILCKSCNIAKSNTDYTDYRNVA